jgi:hypothetical protein
VISRARIFRAFFTALLALFFVTEGASAAPSRGWSKPEALDLAKQAIEAKKAGDAKTCVLKDQQSLALEDHPYVKLHLSACLLALGRYKEALIPARDALAAALRNEDDELKVSAQKRVQEILPKLAHIRLKLPTKLENIKVSINGRPLRPQDLKDPRYTMDPGDYAIEAEREEKGDQYFFRDKGTLEPGEEKTVEVLLKKKAVPPGQQECLDAAESYEAKLRCIEEKQTKPNVRIGVEMSGYTDSTNVHVLTPGINAGVSSPTSGWNVGGSYLLDIVTAASPDLVSQASRRFREERHVGTLSGGYKIGIVQLGANGFLGREPDYLSQSVGVNASFELFDKLVTPRVGYNFSYDRIGMRDSPYVNFERNLTTHSPEAGITFVLSPTTLLVTGISVGIERGENSKLYRFIPMFPLEISGRVPAGASYELVNATRLNIRPREVVPRTRDRVAVGARINHRLSANGTIRIEERIYSDSWGIKASTTDGRYLHDLGEHLRVWPHLRLHAQTGAEFYQLAYGAAVETDGSLVIPQYRTTDRELSPMLAATVGGGARIALTGEKSETQLAIIVSGEVMYNRYLASLFIKSRTAVWGTVGFEAEF